MYRSQLWIVPLNHYRLCNCHNSIVTYLYFTLFVPALASPHTVLRFVAPLWY
jgi:hypothetical protein